MDTSSHSFEIVRDVRQDATSTTEDPSVGDGGELATTSPIAGRTSSWTDEAVCKGQTEIFFGPPAERPERRVERLRLAASFCEVCPVSSECREQGRSNYEHGFWGGESDVERARAGYMPASSSRRSVLAARDAFLHEDQQSSDLTLMASLPFGPVCDRSDTRVRRAPHSLSDDAIDR